METAAIPVPQGNIVGTLLKSPEEFVSCLCREETVLRDGAILLGAGLLFHAAFGFSCGLFGGLSVAIMAAWKGALIALCSLLLCLPSLYVFSCVGGLAITLRQAFALGGTASAMTGLILVALAPVAWLFSVSTNSLVFVTLLNTLLWFCAVTFILGIFKHFLRGRGGTGTGMVAWLLVYILVTLQMAVTLRPLVVEPESGYFVAEKRFFLAHFGRIVQDEGKAQRQQPPPAQQ